MSIADIVTRGAGELGFAMSPTAITAFERYYEYLADQSRVMNLTAISGETDTAQLHFLDSLAVLRECISPGAHRIIDIGSGAGFPGLPMKIAVPEIELTLLDAQQKRVDFLLALCEKLDIAGVTCLHARAEEAAREPEMRGAFDVACSRAVARLNVLCELCLPFVRPGGAFIALKSTESDTEIEEAQSAIARLGAALEAIKDYRIPGTEVVHRAVIIRKTGETADAYPRRFAKIQKSPL